MKRRQYLKVTSIPLTGAIAGCHGEDDIDDGAENTHSGESPPSPTLTDSPTPLPTASPVGFQGRGQQATEAFQVDREVVLFSLTNQGSSNFSAWLLDQAGNQIELLANVIGGYQGARLLNLTPGEYFLDVEGGGWSIDIHQFYPFGTGDPLPVSQSGTFSLPLGPYQADGAVRLQLEGSGNGNYGAWLLDKAGRKVDLLINEIGPVNGSTIFNPSGVFFVEVQTNGDWTVTLQSA